MMKRFFHNVCELDLVFNFYKVNISFFIHIIFYVIFYLKVYSVVDEMFLAGEIRETSQIKVLKQLTTLTSLE
jgi:AP-2 complex subunit sigma-1